ncbi:MAG: endolytic transglycosylase MltG [Synechococcales bacterium]|nr:endolytic transglycosylase MltG [Synechococcales bacterium]
MKKRVWALLMTLAIAGVGSWKAKSWWAEAIAPVGDNGQAGQAQRVVFEVAPGSSAQAIGTQLQKAGLIRSTEAWQWWTRLQGWQNSQGGFQAGTYDLSSQDSMEAIARKIWTGDVIRNSFTIPEGWSMRQMAAYFEQQGYFKAEAFLAATQQVPTQKYPWLPANLPHLEGFLFPDTYEMLGTTLTPEQAITQMLDRFQQVALPIYEQQQGKDPLKLNLMQWVTLASIVEKEAVIPAERGTIAGVFTNRLKIGMTLGSDPTVEYAFGIQQTPENPLTLAQVRTPSPYNTYVTPGLPPTPIASPGKASLAATLSPETTEYLYFVARYDGTHVFSKTLAEHETAQGQIRDRVDGAEAEKKQKEAGSAPNSQPASPSPSPQQPQSSQNQSGKQPER